jgi:hypothetical protein
MISDVGEANILPGEQQTNEPTAHRASYGAIEP